MPGIAMTLASMARMGMVYDNRTNKNERLVACFLYPNV